MNEHYLRNVIEAALLAAGRSVTPAELIQLLDENARPTAEQMRAAIDALAAEYAERGIELKETASGLRVQVRRELAAEVSRLWPERPARYSRALLETLALIAYRQPITRGEIEAVRGVAVNPNIIKTLLERNWVRVVGHRDVPGRPEMLGTTRDFLDYFGLKSLDELPPLSELRAVGDINLQLDLQGEPRARSEGDAAQEAVGEAGADARGAVAPPLGTEGTAAAEVDRAAAGGSGRSGESGAAGESNESDASAEPAEFADFTAPRASGSQLTGRSDAADPAGEPSDEALLEAATEAAEAHRQPPAQEAGESALDDDEEDEGDELSAEGGDSHELVAAPRARGD